MLGGLIAGALSGGANAVGQIADTQIAQQGKMALSKYESDLAVERQTAVARLQQTIGREDALWGTTGEGGQAKVKLAGQEADERAAAERRAGAAIGKDKDYLAGVRAKAQAGHVEGRLAGEQAENLKDERTRRQEVDKLIKEFENPNTTPERQAVVQRQLELRGAFKPVESNTQTVVEETPTPEGGTRKVTRTEKAPGGSGGRRAPDQNAAWEEAKKAVATGRISEADANKRLEAAGLKPLPAAAVPAPAPKPAAAAPAPQADPAAQRQARVAEIRSALQRDDQVKQGGFGGMGLRALQSGTAPLSLGERNSLERELNQLLGR